MIPVKLPKEVLNLFPAWEYRCPSCSTYVESSKPFCPKCKTRFDEKKWRVPPRFLKSRDALSNYAHRVLAPKLSSKQRELLFKYFTELFNDGFESGDFSAWVTGGSGTTTIIEDPVHHGDYAAQGVGTQAYWFKQLASSYSDLYFRGYIRLSSVSTYADIAKIHDSTTTYTLY